MSGPSDVTAVVLAGGQARRMGGVDKGLVALGGRPLAAWVVAALRPQVAGVVINANRNAEIYATLADRVIADELTGYHGPLAGMAAAMGVVATPWIVTAPCDSPFVPPDLVARLLRARAAAGADIVVAHDGERLQPVFALIACRLRDALAAFLASGGRKIDLWYAEQGYATADFADAPRTFLNFNTPDELAAAERELTGA